MAIPNNVLNSFNVHDTLNPKLWTNSTLDPIIRKQLLTIAKDFVDEMGTGVKVQDVTLTGSVANFNWSEFSDIDLHIRIKFSDVDENEELVRNLVLAKKSVWNHAHNITIKGFPVEVYVENVGEAHVASGLYSVLRGKWLVEPKQTQVKVDLNGIKAKAKTFIDDLVGIKRQFNDQNYDIVISGTKDIQDRLKRMRQDGLTNGGEYSVENLTFKALRRSPFIAQLVKLRNDAYDKSKSIDETAERDYKAEYKKFQSSPEKKKYRAQLNKYNRDKGTYGNSDNLDASHKGGKIVGFEKESTNKGRAEKSRLKGSKRKK